jgi:DoxX-like family
VSETMNLHQALETMTLHRAALWAGRIMSAFVVIALVADGAIQLFAPAQIASMLQETGFAMDLTRVVGPIILACAILYAIPATAVLGAILVTGFLGGAICAHVRIGELGSPPEIISLLLGAMAWGGLYLRDPRIRAILRSSVEPTGAALCPSRSGENACF